MALGLGIAAPSTGDVADLHLLSLPTAGCTTKLLQEAACALAPVTRGLAGLLLATTELHLVADHV